MVSSGGIGSLADGPASDTGEECNSLEGFELSEGDSTRLGSLDVRAKFER